MKNKYNRLISPAVLLFYLLLFFLVYAPATKGHYLVGEDYVRIWTSEAKDLEDSAQQSYGSYMRTLPAEGRPLANLYYYVIFSKYINALKSYEAVNTVRYIGIIGIGLLAFILYLIFKEYRFRTDHAFLLSILICTLPPFQIYIGRLIIVVLIYNVLLSALAALILSKTLLKESAGITRNKVIAVSAATILLAASFSVYQPTATTYWAFALIPLIMIKDEDFTKEWRLPFTIFSTGFISMILYLVFIKIFNLMMKVPLVGRADFIGINDIYPKIKWFMTYPFYTALNLWNIVRIKEVALLVSIIIIAGILYSFGRVVRQIVVEKKGFNLLLNLLCRYLLVLIIIPLSYLPHFLVKGHSLGQELPHHRTLIGPEIVVLLLLYWGLMNIAAFIKSVLNFSADLQKKIITIGLVILTVIAASLANHNIDKYFAKRHTEEYRYIKDAVREYVVSNLSKDSKIYILSPDQVAKNHYLIYHEFGVRSSSGRLASLSMAKLALNELGINQDIPIVFINYWDGPKIQLPEDKKALFIDMRKLQ